MFDIPEAKNIRPSYENIVAGCPWCGYENIFNRASALHTFELIMGRDVLCLSARCGKPFRIGGDHANPPHEMLVWDCYELVERKHYMNCILTLAQAYEVFFSLFFRVELLYKPFAADPKRGRPMLNRLAAQLYRKLKRHTFHSMRALFLQHIIACHSPNTLSDALNLIKALPGKPREAHEPDDTAIDVLGDQKLVTLLRALKGTKIHELRNKAIHKQAYRPSRREVDAALKETKSILFPLTSHLKLFDDIRY